MHFGICGRFWQSWYYVHINCFFCSPVSCNILRKPQNAVLIFTFTFMQIGVYWSFSIVSKYNNGICCQPLHVQNVTSPSQKLESVFLVAASLCSVYTYNLTNKYYIRDVSLNLWIIFYDVCICSGWNNTRVA